MKKKINFQIKLCPNELHFDLFFHENCYFINLPKGTKENKTKILKETLQMK